MQKPKKFLSVQKKLFASAAMVGVAGIMVASSTYAWFTLSTAPEVTGITTNIGSNGALEMALNTVGGTLNADSIRTSTDTGAAVTARNKTWGNLVDLSDPSYGLSNITLYPASIGQDGLGASMTNLYVPEYDSDGRINKLVAATAAQYTDAGFEVGNGYGVRAFGTSKTMSPQEVALNTAKANVASSIAAMKNTAVNVLSSSASKIANIAVKHATAGGTDTNTYDTTFIDGMKTQLQGAVTNLDNAIKYYAAAAYAAQSTAGDFTAAEITPEDMTVSYDEGSGTLTITVKTVSISVPDVVKEAYKIKKRISTALGGVGATSATSNYTTAKGLIGKFVNYDNLILQVGSKNYKLTNDPITGYETAVQLTRDGISTFATEYMSAGVVNLLLIEGSGVFADFAQASSNYSATSNFPVEDSGVSVNANAVMKTVVTESPESHIYNVTTASNSLTVDENVPTPDHQYLSDTYAYVIDLAFRTNASNSHLKIQKDGTQRIYSDGTNAETMGGGSNLTLDYSGTGMTAASLDTLMDGGFKVVFFNTATGAKLQTATLTRNTQKTNEDTKTYVADIKIGSDDVICELTQNTATAISVLVYLDGNKVDNSMVPYLGDLKGTLNLQFSSDAELEPMEYSPLK